MLPVYRRLRAAARYGPERTGVGAIPVFHANGAGRREDGPCQRVLGAPLDRGSKRQQFMLGVLPACDGAYHRRLATGERAGLVKGHRGDAARRFQPGAALDEQTVPGGADHAGDHGGRRGEHQRARARHHQHRHCRQPIPGARDEIGQQQHGRRQRQHGRGEELRVVVGSPDDRRPLFLGSGHELPDAANRGRRADAGSADLQGALVRQAAGQYFITGTARLGHRLAGQGRLVHRRLTGHDHPINREALAGADDDDVALAEGRQGDLFLGVLIALAPRRCRQ